MRRSLAASLDHIHSVAGAELDIPQPVARTALDDILAHRVRPGVFGRYYKLVLAIERGDLAQARGHFLGIAALARRPAEFSAVPFTAAALGDEKDLYGDLIDEGAGGPPWMVPPRPDQSAGFADKVSEALDGIAAADGALAREIRNLTIEVVGGAPFPGPDARPFGSGSSMMLWGLMVLNLERYTTAASLFDPLVHEAAHQLLYAHSIDEPLVTNPVDQRYPSPLRSDLRPMDGVFHATFVAARLHYGNRKLRDAAAAGLAARNIATLDARLSMLRDNFFNGLPTIRQFGKLTATGERILDESLDYMKTA